MYRTALAIIIATTFAAPAFAQSYAVNLPLLTYPSKPAAPVVDQSCVDLIRLDTAACPAPAK
ncbi:hypothetical protein SAMN04488005_3086 [Yoonia tamlensis]|uniref:Uncharacterized protein n=1 Tax=Yoonia tamlensis TaxID=390270 RepID=A0A1I6HXB8_9RHOB|nr:hypothetical protein [Yoonia tamlensis]SFR59093.1 hypothetical protein SAMN04488005_3086 [Yoonia tamlensis]